MIAPTRRACLGPCSASALRTRRRVGRNRGCRVFWARISAKSSGCAEELRLGLAHDGWRENDPSPRLPAPPDSAVLFSICWLMTLSARWSLVVNLVAQRRRLPWCTALGFHACPARSRGGSRNPVEPGRGQPVACVIPKG
jgi:hypothetical protein